MTTEWGGSTQYRDHTADMKLYKYLRNKDTGMLFTQATMPDFTATFHVECREATTYVCSKVGSTYSSCTVETDGKIIFAIPKNTFLTGKLICKLRPVQVDALFTDGTFEDSLGGYTGVTMI